MNRFYHTPLFALLIIILIPILAGCRSGQDAAAQAIESYIQALSKKDRITLSNLSCSDWEAEAMVELDSLGAVGSKVENLACQKNGQEGSDTYISCTGDLVLDYNGEVQQIDLSTRTYIARQEAGEWRMCGYH